MKQRVTDEQATRIKNYCKNPNGNPENCYGCRYEKEDQQYCPNTWLSPNLAADLLDTRAKLVIAVKALEKISGRGMTGGGIAKKALKEVQE